MKIETVENGRRCKWTLTRPELAALVAFAATDAESLPHLCCVSFDEAAHTAASTDGHRAVLAETRDVERSPVSPKSHMLAIEHAKRLVRMAEKDEAIVLTFGIERVECDLVADGQLSLFAESRAFELPLILDGKFPDVNAIVRAASSEGDVGEGVSVNADLLAPIVKVQRAAETYAVRFSSPRGPLDPIVVRAENAEKQTSWVALVMPVRAEGDEDEGSGEKEAA